MTTLVELKKAIQNRSLDDSLFIFSYQDNPFLAFEYAKAIANVKEVEMSMSEDFDYTFSDSQANMFDFSEIDYLRLFVMDEFNTELPRNILSTLKNVVVICKKVDNKILDLLKELEIYFEFPKLQDWQIEDYMKVSCPGLSEDKVKWLCKITNYDIYRLDNEAKKINCFNKDLQDDVFSLIDMDDGYNDLTQSQIFNLSNAINARDLLEVDRIMKDIANMDVEPVGLITILKRSFMLILKIQMDKTATASSLNIKPLQYNIIKSKNCGKFTDEKLRKIIEFLSNFDYKLKSGGYDITKEQLINYIVCEVLS